MISRRLRLIALFLIAASTAIQSAEHSIRPEDSPQQILDRAAPGDRLIFLPGQHEHGPGKFRSLLYVDKPVEIELRESVMRNNRNLLSDPSP